LYCLQDRYTVYIDENSPPGMFVVNVNATDQDTGDFGVVRYRLPDSVDNTFAIDEVTVSCRHQLAKEFHLDITVKQCFHKSK